MTREAFGTPAQHRPGGGMTLAAGLPIPVAAPAHGPAFDVAGRGRAGPKAMRKAFVVVCRSSSGPRSDRA